ncbi:hypothetical protein HYW35_01550 [Candidatus Saccharibacteria bacterium]|nr:hypothetical protein [Candidatus Saccharibacteria bacterium]
MFRPLSKRSWLAVKFGVGALLLATFLGTAYAGADNIPRSFKAKDDLQLGVVVAISRDDSSSVELAPAGTPDRIYGVVISPSEASVSIQNRGQQVLVANGGIYSVLVTAEKGSISSGNYLSISSTDGVAAKATSNDSYVLGRALQGFDGNNSTANKTSSTTISDKIRVQIAPGKNPLINSAGLVPEPIKRLSEYIAGRRLSLLRIYTVFAIFLITMIVSFTLVWVGVRSGMVAIGRNPLSRHTIMRSLSQVIFSAVGVFFAGLTGIYLILRL